MSDKSRELQEKLESLQHAMQTGVAHEMKLNSEADGALDRRLKHLRVGVNSALVFQGALVDLLEKKGILSQDEYLQAAVSAMTDEVQKYEKLLSDAMGAKITLK